MLGLAMREVRFPAMTVQEFADHAVKSDMLNLQVETWPHPPAHLSPVTT